MSKKKIILLPVIGLLLIAILIPFIFSPINFNDFNHDNNEHPVASANLEGIENILIQDLDRNVNLLGYGLVNIEDFFSVLNQNDNPINSIFIGIRIDLSDDLIFFKATGYNDNSLLTERSNMIMNDYEMIIIYFDSPLLPQQERTIKITHSYQNLLNYTKVGNKQLINFTGEIFPIFPYKSIGDVRSLFKPPTGALQINFEKVGSMGTDTGTGISYDIATDGNINFIEPFLENLSEDQKEVKITFEDNPEDVDPRFTKIEMDEINREISISPWGIIKIKEDYIIHNKGVIDISRFSLNFPDAAKNLHVSDDLGELLGTTINEDSGIQNYSALIINLANNRAILTPNSKLKFTVEYNLPIGTHYSFNWIRESIQIDMFTSIFDYLGKEQVIKIIIEGCNNIDFISSQPYAIEELNSAKILVYKFNNVGPLERKLLQFTFTIDIFDLLLRPLMIIMIIAVISSLYVFIVKVKRGEEALTPFKRELIPVNEIREYCYLYEEMNALILEIRKTEEDAKYKKVARKQYKNVMSKNSSKIEQIKHEIIPFKQILMKTNETFENIIKRLDVLDAERTSVNDSLNLLESRYKQGKLPSKAAFQKLSNDFMNRRKKIDRTIDKFIQQLRSYLL